LEKLLKVDNKKDASKRCKPHRISDICKITRSGELRCRICRTHHDEEEGIGVTFGYPEGEIDY